MSQGGEGDSIVEVKSLDKFPREQEPPERENSRRWFNGVLLALFVFQIAAPLLVAIFIPASLDPVLKVLSITFGITSTLLGTSLAFYFGNSLKNR